MLLKGNLVRRFRGLEQLGTFNLTLAALVIGGQLDSPILVQAQNGLVIYCDSLFSQSVLSQFD